MTNMQLEKSTNFQLLLEINIQFFIISLLYSDFRESSESLHFFNSPVPGSIASSNEHSGKA